MTKILSLFLLSFLFWSCSSTKDEPTPKQIYFFDLAGYFHQQAALLGQKKVTKTVAKNEITETKDIQIRNWEQEFSLFIEADINKSAWRDSYLKDSTATLLTYTAKDPDLRVKKISINFSNQYPEKIVVETQSKNLLYHTTEKLIYIPDSVYQITKHQKVFMLGLNNYEITGKFHPKN